MLFNPMRTKRRAMVEANPEGSGNIKTAAEDGTCVKTMVLTRPMRLANGPASMVENAARK
jgi:hypothetical protein